MEEKKIKYPDNLYLRVLVFEDPRTQQEIADAIGFSRKTLNDTINGKYKGENLIPILLENLNKQKETTSEPQ